MRLLLASILTFSIFSCQENKSLEEISSAFERSNGDSATAYEEGMEIFKSLAKNSPYIEISRFGFADNGMPLHYVIYSEDQNFNPFNAEEKNKNIVLINNSIHAGEPDGTDASILLLKNLATQASLRDSLKNTVILIIPFYNLGGALNRNSSTRVNQNGPAEYGFRGSSRNYDLNRDFIKADAENTKAFYKLFHEWNPDIFIDNHVSNGADYQYTLTYIATQYQKLGIYAGPFLKNILEPEIKADLSRKGIINSPYVNVFHSVPDSGFQMFLETPRYATGYTALFHSFGFVCETHMLKPYKERVNATLEFMNSILKITELKGKEIKEIRKIANEEIKYPKYFTINWTINSDSFEWLNFKGYEAEYLPSKITGKPRLFYNRNKKFEKPIKFYSYYQAKDSIKTPEAYFIPKAWGFIAERLKENGVYVGELSEDSVIEVESYQIVSENTYGPYEGHYVHNNIETKTIINKLKFKKGDFVIKCNQKSNRFIIETLEPKAVDSYFAWGFFDIILQRKEYFSDYVFEDLAYDYLIKNEELKSLFDKKKLEDTAFNNNASAQLKYIYENSPWAESSYRIYPIHRIPAREKN